MKRAHKLLSLRLLNLVVLASPLGLLLVGLVSTSGSAAVKFPSILFATATSAAPTLGAPIDPAKIIGTMKGDCKKCHASAVASWMKSVHFKSDDALFSANAKKYASALGITAASLKTDSMCVNCHATRQQNSEGKQRAISGVSCESCHGAAGGENGWLNRHAVYGPNVTKRKDETAAHREQRLDYCKKAGMIRPDRTYNLAKNCLSCHIIGDEKLVAAGHKASSAAFELVSWVGGEVRHNFFLNPDVNAACPTLWKENTGRTAIQRKRVMFVVGLLVDLEMSLRHRAGAKNPTYAAQLGARVGAINGKLAQINAVAATPETAAMAGVVIQSFARLFAPQPGDDKFFTGLADQVAEAGKKFSRTNDGSQLKGLDSLFPPPHYRAR